MNKAKSRIKYQTLRITHALGTTPQIIETRVTLDNAYDKCTGIAVFIVARTAPDNISLGFQDDTQTYQDNTFVTMNESTTAVKHADRFKDFDIRANGNTVRVQSEIAVTLGAAYTYDVVFKLENKETA